MVSSGGKEDGMATASCWRVPGTVMQQNSFASGQIEMLPSIHKACSTTWLVLSTDDHKNKRIEMRLQSSPFWSYLNWEVPDCDTKRALV